MAVNPKAIKVLNKVLDAGFTDEKAIAAMTIDDILKMQGVTVTDIGIINELQKSIKANKEVADSEYGADQPYYRQKRRCVSFLTQLQ